MPKDQRANSSSFDRSTVSPYSNTSEISNPTKPEMFMFLPNSSDEREWEQARCPICIEHPHNAVLLLCSSHENGCRPFICDTSYRHSNCFDQFRKSSLQSQLVCPLCRGVITGWDVVGPPRRFMNDKRRNCSLDTCEFNGSYGELRKHARVEHPFERPSEADPARLSDWMMLEQRTDMEDALAHQPGIEPEWDRWSSRDGSIFNFPSGLLGIRDNLLGLSGIREDLLGQMFSRLISLMFMSLRSSLHGEDLMYPGSSMFNQVENDLLDLNSTPLSNYHGENE